MIRLLANAPKDWKRVPLEELFDVRGGFPAPQNDEAFVEGVVPFVRMKDLGRYHFTNNLNQVDYFLNKSSASKFQITPKGSILMPRSGSVALNHRAILGMDAVVVSHICALVPKRQDFDIEFLYRLLCLIDMKKLTKKTTGLDSIAFSDVKQIEIPLPPLPEQQRLASILDSADQVRRLRAQTLEKLDELVAALFLDSFGDQMEQTKSIGELLDSGALLLHKDGNHGSNYPRVEEFGDCGVPFLSAKSFTSEGELIRDEVAFLNEDKANTLKIGWIESGDVLLAHNASVGRVALYGGQFERALIGTSLTAFRPNPNFLSGWFLAYALRSRAFQSQLERNMGQSTRNQVPITAQRELKIPLPPLPLQQQFAARVEAIEAVKARAREALVESDALFLSLQERAFAGAL